MFIPRSAEWTRANTLQDGHSPSSSAANNPFVNHIL
jgi:hypothetical protein